MIQTSIYGRLGRDPKMTLTKTGQPMCTASIAVDVGKAPGEETLWISVLAFGQWAEALQCHSQGDMLGAMGKLTRSHYTGKDGAERESWSLMADALHSSRTVRPQGGKRREAGDSRNAPHTAPRGSRGEPSGIPEFDDEISF